MALPTTALTAHCNKENSWRPSNNITYHPHPRWGSAGLGEEADKGENPSAAKAIMKIDSVPAAPVTATSTAPLCNRYRRHRQAGVGERGKRILTQTQLHEIILILCTSHLTAHYVVVSALEIQTAWL